MTPAAELAEQLRPQRGRRACSRHTAWWLPERTVTGVRARIGWTIGEPGDVDLDWLVPIFLFCRSIP